MKTSKRQRKALTAKGTIPYTILAMTEDGEDVNGYWHIKTAADERMFIEHANPAKEYSIRKDGE